MHLDILSMKSMGGRMSPKNKKRIEIDDVVGGGGWGGWEEENELKL